MLMTIGFLFGVAIAAPTFYALGRISKIDRLVTHERADISSALRRSVR